MKKSVIILLYFVTLFGVSYGKNFKSQLNGITGLIKFDFEGEAALSGYTFAISPDSEENTYLIQNTDSLPKGTDVTKLKAGFQTINSLVKVKVNGIEQVSGVTENDFTNPLIYEVYAERGNVKTYKVIVKVAKKPVVTEKYIFFNHGLFAENEIQDIVSIFGKQSDKKVAVGIGVIVSVLNASTTDVVEKINSQLALASKYCLPVSIKLDAEVWWEYRSDLWNWWDQSKPGFNPDNKDNVEWTDWTNDSAVKLGWLNWGRQIRMVPTPNLMSPRYKEAWKSAMTASVNAIKLWYDELPADKKYLFGSIVIGWESSIGVTNHFYPNGNGYLNQPEANDPTTGFDISVLPSRGLQSLGYAAVKTAGIASSGTMTETMQTEVVRRHLEDLSKTVYELGIPREKIYTHCGGWVKGEILYTAANNQYSCPGWSFYDHASDPATDLTAMDALSKSDAPYWGAVEWLLQGNKTEGEWTSALNKTLSGNCRMITIYNWENVNSNYNAIEAIRRIDK